MSGIWGWPSHDAVDVAVDAAREARRRWVGYGFHASNFAGPAAVFELASNVSKLTNECVDGDFLKSGFLQIVLTERESLAGEQ